MLACVVDSLVSILSFEIWNLLTGKSTLIANDMTFQDKWDGEGVSKPRGHLGTLQATVWLMLSNTVLLSQFFCMCFFMYFVFPICSLFSPWSLTVALLLHLLLLFQCIKCWEDLVILIRCLHLYDMVINTVKWSNEGAKIVSWNIADCRNVVKRKKILTYFKQKKMDIVLMQETHLNEEEWAKLKGDWVTQVYYSMSTLLRKWGVITLVTKNTDFIVHTCLSHKEGRWAYYMPPWKLYI